MRGFLRVILAQAKLYVFLCQSAFAGGFFSRPVVLRDHVVGAAAIRLVFVAGLFRGGDVVAVAGALEVGHVAGRVAVAQLAVAAGAAQTVVGFGGHDGTPYERIACFATSSDTESYASLMIASARRGFSGSTIPSRTIYAN